MLSSNQIGITNLLPIQREWDAFVKGKWLLHLDTIQRQQHPNSFDPEPKKAGKLTSSTPGRTMPTKLDLKLNAQLDYKFWIGVRNSHMNVFWIYFENSWLVFH
jgi:hypothetical protein